MTAEIMIQMKGQNVQKSSEKNIGNISTPASTNIGHTDADMFCTFIDPVQYHTNFDNVTGSTQNNVYKNSVHQKNPTSLEFSKPSEPTDESMYTAHRHTEGHNVLNDRHNKNPRNSVISNMAHVKKSMFMKQNTDADWDTNSTVSTIETLSGVQHETMIGFF